LGRRSKLAGQREGREGPFPTRKVAMAGCARAFLTGFSLSSLSLREEQEPPSASRKLYLASIPPKLTFAGSLNGALDCYNVFLL
jgi:hypothetical protein